MSAALRWVGAATLTVLGGLGLSLALGHLALGLPLADLPAIGGLMLGGALGGAIVGGGLLHPALLRRLGRLRWQIAAASLAGSLVLLVLLLAVTQAMFISSDHDLPLLLTLLIFVAVLALGYSVALGYLLAGRVQELRAGAGRIAEGDLSARLAVRGSDELAALAGDLNTMAEALERAAARQEELERSRRALVAAVSHDLRTPISAVRALVEALADGVVSDRATEERYLRSARAELERLTQLVDDLFELARIDAGVLELELERASLRDLVSDVLSSMQPRAESQGIALIGEFEAEGELVLVNPPHIQRVLYNLLSNALRHTPADGTIFVRVRSLAEEAVQVEVQDTGAGISADDLPHIFGWSYRGEQSRSREHGGSGLGLAIARGLVEAHGGRIWAESGAGGALLAFTLPLTPGPSPRTRKRVPGVERGGNAVIPHPTSHEPRGEVG